MLRYLSHGSRELGDFPMPPHKRVNWEFFAVTEGRVAPLLETKENPAFSSSSLWVFPPGFSHGWNGEPGRKCEVVVIHYNSVPPALERLVNERGFLSVRMNGKELRRVTSLAKTLKRHYWNPVLVSEIYTERALHDLSLILLSPFEESWQPNQTGVNLRKILIAEGWLKAHLADNPSVQNAARAAGISGSQLRRLFLKVRKSGPKKILNKLRFDAAMRMMAESDAKLQNIAAATGFSSATNFCRAFKVYNGKSPTAWRREIYIQYKRPSGTEKTEYSHHGRRYREL